MSSFVFDALPEIGAQLRQASAWLVCLDFDGTLVPIAPDPSQVTLSPQVRRKLVDLTASPRSTVAIVSGRQRADLQERVGVPGLIYVGNHGLEISGDGFIFVESGAAENRPALEQVAADLNQRLQSIPGILIEDKGLTLSVHYRQVDTSAHDEVRRLVHACLAGTSHPFHLTAGLMVYDVRPRVNWSKASAVRWIQEHLNQPNLLVFYAGDDRTDEDAFAEFPQGVTVKVGDPTNTSAHYFVNTPEEFWRFLDWLIATMTEAWRLP